MDEICSEPEVMYSHEYMYQVVFLVEDTSLAVGVVDISRPSALAFLRRNMFETYKDVDQCSLWSTSDRK